MYCGWARLGSCRLRKQIIVDIEGDGLRGGKTKKDWGEIDMSHFVSYGHRTVHSALQEQHRLWVPNLNVHFFMNFRPT